MSSTAPLAILILSDGRPGHYHLAEGVAAAIARRRPTQVTRIAISKRKAIPGRLLARLQPLAMARIGGLLSGLAWLLAGGLCYTFGTLFYRCEGRRYFHAIWHVFVLAGSAFHFCAVLFHAH